MISPLARSESKNCYLGHLFLTPKADAVTSRAIYDARAQNAKLHWCTLPAHGRFRLPRTLHQVMVGTGHGLDGDILGCEVDYRSFFFLFRWAPALRRAHAFRLGPRPYGFDVPTQGSSVMPRIAQATSLALADGPGLLEDPARYVDARVTITYDNIMMVDRPDRLRQRLEILKQRSERVGAIVGSVQGPDSEQITSCGLQYDLKRREWKLKDEWCRRTLTFLAQYPANPSLPQRQTLAGLALWAMRATLRPLTHIMPLLHHEYDEAALGLLRHQLLRNAPRRLWPTTSTALPQQYDLLYTDASLTAGGAVWRDTSQSFPWPQRRPMEEQQEAEADAARMALAWLSAQRREPLPIVLAMDNLGVLFALIMGAPTTPAQAELVEELEIRARAPVWVAFVPGKQNPADGPSRLRDAPGPDPVGDQLLVSNAVLLEWTCAQHDDEMGRLRQPSATSPADQSATGLRADVLALGGGPGPPLAR